MISISKRLFTYVSRISLKCLTCRFVSSSYCENQTLFLYPNSNTSIDSLFSNSSFSSVSKLCGCCGSSTLHEQTTILEQPPEILIMVICRFGSSPDSSKNLYKIDLTPNITISTQNYGLIGSVHHHGTTITSGHYTSNIYYPSSSFTCNDTTIEIIRPTTYSNSSYLVFYARGGCQHGTQRMGARSHDAGTSSVSTTRVEE